MSGDVSIMSLQADTYYELKMMVTINNSENE